MKISRKRISLLFIICISLLLINTNTVRADWYYIYTFDDEDSIGPWDIAYGNWTVDNGSLLVAECEYVNEWEGCANSIWHEQASMTGNWSFDVMQSDQEDSRVLFYFIGNGVGNAFEFHPAQGYVLRLKHDLIAIDYVNEGTYRYSLSTYTPSNNLTGWNHLEVTRDNDNEMVVYLNGSEKIRITNSLISLSENINIQTATGARFDNFYFPNTSPFVSGYRILPLFICTVGVIIVYTKKQKSKSN